MTIERLNSRADTDLNLVFGIRQTPELLRAAWIAILDQGDAELLYLKENTASKQLTLLGLPLDEIPEKSFSCYLG